MFRRTVTGHDLDGLSQTEADHHMKCPACGEWYNMRDFGQMAEHIHGGGDTEGPIQPGEGPVH